MILSKDFKWLEAAKSALVGVVCVSLVAPQAFAETPAATDIPAPRQAAPLTQQQKVLHTLRLSQADLLRRFPSPAVIRQMARRGDPLPSDPVEHAIYADALAAYDAKAKNQSADSGNAQNSKMTGDGSMQQEAPEIEHQAANQQATPPVLDPAKG